MTDMFWCDAITGYFKPSLLGTLASKRENRSHFNILKNILMNLTESN